MNYIKVPSNQIEVLGDIPIWIKRDGKNDFVLLRKNNSNKRIPELFKKVNQFFVLEKDRPEMIKILKKELTEKILSSIRQKDIEKMREILTEIVENFIFSNPFKPEIKICIDLMPSIIDNLNKKLIKSILKILNKDYTTATHSFNVMVLCLNYAIYENWEHEKTRLFSLSGLFHDVGKVKISEKILQSNSRLTDEEFLEMKKHTNHGNEIINKQSDLQELDRLTISEVCSNHHEKLDGSGYFGLKEYQISEFSRIIGVIDCFEALTSDNRLYRRSMRPIEACALIKKDVRNKKYSKRIFEKFVTSLLE